MEINEDLDRLTRNRLRLAIVKASTDNKTETPTLEQIINALVLMFPNENKESWLEKSATLFVK